MKKKFIIFALFVGICFIAFGQQRENPASDFEYTESNGKITITKYIGQTKNVVIPSTINNLPVIAIGNEAFFQNQLTSVIIPNSITSIDHFAFSNNQLKSITIPNSVSFIGHGAFFENQLTSIIIPNSISSINKRTFANNKLTSVTIPNSVTLIDGHERGGAFSNNQLSTVTIPNSVTSIEENAFANNQLTIVTIPNSVISIAKNAFVNNRLTSINIPNSNTSINQQAFDKEVNIVQAIPLLMKNTYWASEQTRNPTYLLMQVRSYFVYDFKESSFVLWQIHYGFDTSGQMTITQSGGRHNVPVKVSEGTYTQSGNYINATTSKNEKYTFTYVSPNQIKEGDNAYTKVTGTDVGQFPQSLLPPPQQNNRR